MITNGKIIGFTCGAMDLLHCGHLMMLKECKSKCDLLIVGLHTDPTIDRPEKNKPIETIEERRERLQACKYVDKIIEYDTEEELYHILKRLQPVIDVRFIGADWEGKKFTGDDLDIHICFNSRNHNYSSTNLRKRIYEAESKCINS